MSTSIGIAEIERARHGDPDALTGLVRAIWSDVRRMAEHCARPADVEDIAQDALVALVENLPRLRDGGALSRWIATLVRTAASRRYRRMGERSTTSVAELDIVGDVDPERELADDEARGRLHAVLVTLTADEHMSIARCDLAGQPIARACAASGISEAAFKSRLHRARLQLRTRMRATEDGVGRSRQQHPR